jgi:hypothetical protein
MNFSPYMNYTLILDMLGVRIFCLNIKSIQHNIFSFIFRKISTNILQIFFLNITIKNFYLCLFNSHIFSDFLDCLWYNKTLIYWLFGQEQIYCTPRHQLFPSASRREIVGVSGDNKLAIVPITSN